MTNEADPDAWMSYNNAGGAGLVPYLLKSRAESNTNVVTEEDTEYPQPMFTFETIRDVIEHSIESSQNLQSNFEEGSPTWRQFQKAIDEKKAILRKFQVKNEENGDV